MTDLSQVQVVAPAPTSHSLAVRPPAVEVIVSSPSAALRPEMEAFIREGFRRTHGAQVHSFMPVLIGLRDHGGQIIGAAGYRSAARERLYLEQYLDGPVEEAITRSYPLQTVRRSDVAEIGNFACTDCACAMTLISILAEFLFDQRHRWAVFTATHTIRRITRRLGIGLTELKRADRTRVASGRDEWGAYYSADPRVMLADVLAWRGAANPRSS